MKMMYRGWRHWQWEQLGSLFRMGATYPRRLCISLKLLNRGLPHDTIQPALTPHRVLAPRRVHEIPPGTPRCVATCVSKHGNGASSGVGHLRDMRERERASDEWTHASSVEAPALVTSPRVAARVLLQKLPRPPARSSQVTGVTLME